MRILHLAYEDPAQPGSGGGSVRTREINRRLSTRHQITAIVASYPGARVRVQDGVRWIPIGTRSGTKLDRLVYFALLGLAVRRYPHDLLVEDFGAPFSVGLAPLWTRRPVVASVQWLFAGEMRQKYGLPFDLAERSGLYLYHDFVVVSEWLAGTVRARRPGARIETIPNGVEPFAFSVPPQPPRHFLFVGRLDAEQKGCDLLLDAFARIHAGLGPRTPPLKIAGDGPDRARLEQQIRRLELEQHVAFCGRVTGQVKYELMASACAVLMPSRFETFGMVAVEAQAAGAPLVAFDVGPLREVAGGGGARLVVPFDVDAFAAEALTLATHPERTEPLRETGRRWARRFDWDEIAARQEAHYLQAVQMPVRSLHARRGPVHRKEQG